MLATLLNAGYAAQCWLLCSMLATLLNAGKDFNAATTLLNASKDSNAATLLNPSYCLLYTSDAADE